MYTKQSFRTLSAVCIFSFASPSTAQDTPQLNGSWSSVSSWPVLPIHAVVSSSGDLLTFGAVPGGSSDGEGGKNYDVWNPQANSHNTVAQSSHDYFCAANVTLPGSGNVLIAGGDDFQTGVTANDFLSLYDPSTQTLSSGDSMESQRWYPTATVLSNGEVLVTGGTYNYSTHATTPEIYNQDTGWRELTGAKSNTLFGQNAGYFYPRVWAAPNGKAFGIAQQQMFWLDPNANNGNGHIEIIGKLPDEYPSRVTSSAVMFETGKILQVGGGGRKTFGGDDALKSAIVIDINGATPVITRIPDMNFPRHWANSTVLPNGKVLINGGAKVNNEYVGVAYVSELWDPTNNSWTEVAAESIPRLYHATAALLPDGRIFSGGGGNPGPEIQHNAQFYSPPYLFNSNGTAATRPKIEFVQAAAGYSSSITTVVTAGQDISRVTLVRSSSTTHSFNMDQRFIELSFSQSGQTLSVTTPKNNLVAPPGYYLLSVINDYGVVSKSSIVQLGDFNSVAAAIPTIANTVAENNNDSEEVITIEPPSNNGNVENSAANIDFSAQIQQVSPEKCIAIVESGNANTVACSGNAATQIFDFYRVAGSSNLYTIQAHQSGDCLTVAGASTANKANISQQNCSGVTHQEFRLVADGNKNVLYTNTGTGSKVVDASISNNGNIQQWKDFGNNNQRWKLLLQTDSSNESPTVIASNPTTDDDNLDQPAAVAQEDEDSVSNVITNVSTSNGTPICTNSSFDPDGDGWGWENQTSCIVNSTIVTETITQAETETETVTTSGTNSSKHPTCSNKSFDSDGDGWGWENHSSCVVQQ